ncbi:hypothetical protein CR513_29005, partial [Mucuna pruriens]
MILRDDGNIKSESSHEDSSSSSEVEPSSDIFHYESDFLICLVMVKLCSLIIYGWTSLNVASLRLVKKLAIPTIAHPRPYNFEKGEMVMDRQVSLVITLGNYIDEILCDVIPMKITLILLGRPWEFDRRVTHDGVPNRFSFEHLGQKVILKPLSPKRSVRTI